MSTDTANIDQLRAALKQSVRKLAALQNDLAQIEQRQHEPIAIVGIGCRLPGDVGTPDEFWQLLIEARDGIRDIPADRPLLRQVAAERPAFRRGGFIADVGSFDATFFGISPREAVWIDPQQRLLLEVSWHALEHAGQLPDQLAGTRSGVFLGMVSSEGYLEATRAASRVAPDIYAATGSTMSVAAGRIAYTLGLHGPALVVDTACSSSLVAVHLACRSLRENESDLALAGGVSLMLSAHDARVLTVGDALAPDGRCRAFDASASGLVRAEGCGIVVLKRLSDAKAQGDRVLAVIRGSAVNQDGRSAGLTAPNLDAQTDVLRRALANARVEPGSIGFVETHGTGTALGDPIELEALKLVYGQPSAAAPNCLLGAVKSNLGHTEAAAGMTGLIKAVLALQHECIPANLHFSRLNPHVSFQDTRLQIPTTARTWSGTQAARRAGVSSFGMSGTNVHVVLEEAPPSAANPTPAEAQASAKHLLLVSARDDAALREQAGRYASYLASNAPPLEDVCYTAARRRCGHDRRLVVSGENSAELIDGLRAAQRGEVRPGVVSGSVLGFHRPKLVFVFPGQGSQWFGMGRQLYAAEPVFRRTVDACARAADACVDWSLLDALLTNADAAALEQTRMLQPLVLTLELALAALLQERGIVPDAVVGASMGEVAAAHVAGILGLDEAMTITCKRSALLRQLEGRGAMALTELSFEQAQRWIAPYAGRIAIASSNSPRSTVLSGDRAALEELLEQLGKRKLFCRWVNAKGAGHSPQVDEILDTLARELGEITPGKGRLPVYSTVEGGLLPSAAFGTEYWLRNIRQTVRFSHACEALIADGHSLFLEVSPHPILLPSIRQVAEKLDKPCVSAGTLYRERDESQALLEAVSALHCAGYAVDWSSYYPRGELVALPPYPFRRERHWMELPEQRPARADMFAPSEHGTTGTHPLLGTSFRVAHPTTVRYWQQTLRLADLPYLADHRIERAIVLPAAAVIELACAAAQQALGSSDVVLEDLALHRALILDEHTNCTLQVALEETAAGGHTFLLACLVEAAAEAERWQVHASCSVRRATEADLHIAPHTAAETTGCDQPRDPALVYERLAAMGGSYGPAFRGLTHAWCGPYAAKVEASLPLAVSDQGYLAHPALLDACLQALAVAELPVHARSEQPCVPVAIARVLVRDRLPRVVRCEVRIDPASVVETSLCADLVVYAAGTASPLLSISGLQLRPLLATSQPAAAKRSALDSLIYDAAWRTADANAVQPANVGRWLILADRRGVGAALRAELLRAGGEAECVYVDGSALDESELATQMAALLRTALSAQPTLRGIVHLCGLDDDSIDIIRRDRATTDRSWITGIGRRGWWTALHLARALGSARLRDTPQLCLVSCDAQSVRGDEQIDPAQALLWGLGGSIRSEAAGWQVRRIDLSSASAQRMASQLARELFAADDEDQVALRADQRYVARLARAEPVSPPSPETRFAARADATYLITGGMSGLGLSAAAWLAARGAGHLLLLGRNLPADEAFQAKLRALQQLGSRVTALACDVSDAGALGAALAPYRDGTQRLGGVIHAAGVLRDGLLERQSLSSFEAVMLAKVGGAWLLHELTRELPVELFVLYSSAAGLIGSAGQANYVAANAFLDALAHHRRRLGLAALSIDWGQFGEVGRVRDLEFRGLRPLTEQQGHELLDVLVGGPAQRAALALELPELLDFYPQLARWPYLQELIGAAEREAAKGDPLLLAALTTGDRAQRNARMRDHLRGELSRVLRMDPARIEESAPLSRLGLDSLMGLELRRRLEASLGVALEATLVWTYPTVAAAAEYLADRIAPGDSQVPQLMAADEAWADEPEQHTADFAALSDDQLWDLTNTLVN